MLGGFQVFLNPFDLAIFLKLSLLLILLHILHFWYIHIQNSEEIIIFHQKKKCQKKGIKANEKSPNMYSFRLKIKKNNAIFTKLPCVTLPIASSSLGYR